MRRHTQPRLEFLEMLRLLFLVTPKELQHATRHISRLRGTHRPQGHRLGFQKPGKQIRLTIRGQHDLYSRHRESLQNRGGRTKYDDEPHMDAQRMANASIRIPGESF